MLDICGAATFIADQATCTNLAEQKDRASILDTKCDKSRMDLYSSCEGQGSGPYTTLPGNSGRSILSLRQMETLPVRPGSWQFAKDAKALHMYPSSC